LNTEWYSPAKLSFIIRRVRMSNRRTRSSMKFVEMAFIELSSSLEWVRV